MEQGATRIAGIVLCLALAASAAAARPATPGTPWKRAELFATCSGRLSAITARQQAVDDPAWPRTMDQRDMFNLMLEATLPEAIRFGVPKDEPVLWRSAGWAEMAGLLADIAYSFDSGRADRARAALADRMSDCTGLLLGG
ncbi:hypothetical protein JMJ94_03115 [Rhodovulum visakhapatnamense]|uniref:Uncharacterized protein n=1 Tax=Rhodovulum visakhapatnamense TaxID=364297 RepID=A0ABS1RIK3_9RHOB|nr:hypothetical protein [Rhodovulum visakhapatnamense]MBL3568490.1 hypothetical protein [Rhodovulum visakhapatnamense]MBL3579490.1 hypothetical protein [Rhodovulum visakhapatnamense]